VGHCASFYKIAPSHAFNIAANGSGSASPPVDPKEKYPMCVEGERACPPEDCGGVWGYVDFLEAIRNPKHEEHESMLEWIGGRFDSE
jgi:hypothetical protein